MPEENGHYRKSDIDIGIIKEKMNVIGDDINEIKGSIKELVSFGTENRKLIMENCSKTDRVKDTTAIQWYFIGFILLTLVGGALKILIAGGKL